jgi:hypothetical protein
MRDPVLSTCPVQRDIDNIRIQCARRGKRKATDDKARTIDLNRYGLDIRIGFGRLAVKPRGQRKRKWREICDGQSGPIDPPARGALAL